MSKDIKKVTDEDLVFGDMDKMFEDIIMIGNIEKEKVIAKGFKIKVKPLSAEETFIAERTINLNIYSTPQDIVGRVRNISILCSSIIALNDISIDRDDLEEKDNRKRRVKLYEKLMDLPTEVLQKAYDFYLTVVADQNKLFENDEDVVEGITNF